MMQETRNWGGAREGAGRPHEHQEYLLVEVVDFYGDKDVLIAGPLLNRNGTPNKSVEQEAEKMAAHHVGEQARSVKIVKRLSGSHGESELVRIVK
jgi:hypothetical protein